MNAFNVKQFSVTKLVKDKYSYLWKIDWEPSPDMNFLCSSRFTLTIDGSNTYFQILYLIKKNLFSVKFCNNPLKKFSLYKMKIRFVISNSEEKEIECLECESNLENKTEENLCVNVLAPKLKDKILPDHFTVLCEIFCLKYVAYIENYSTLLLNGECMGLETVQKTRDTFEHLFKTGKFSDFTIVAPCKKTFQVHKFILSAQSPVFKTLIESEEQEKAKNILEIKDINYEAIREMLRFMYTGKVQNIENSVNEILEAAEKYQIEKLKDLCITYIF